MSTQTDTATNTEAFYLVKMIVIAADYQKEAIAMVSARCPTEAKANALLGEAHNEIIDEGNGWFKENDDSFSYFVKEPVVLSASEAAVFEKYGI